jgi:hypothetical protein
MARFCFLGNGKKEEKSLGTFGTKEILEGTVGFSLLLLFSV